MSELLNLVGLSTGVVLHAMLLALEVRARRATGAPRRDVLGRRCAALSEDSRTETCAQLAPALSARIVRWHGQPVPLMAQIEEAGSDPGAGTTVEIRSPADFRFAADLVSAQSAS